MRTKMIAGLIASLALAAGATTASAAPLPAWDCEAGAFCLYDRADGNGLFYQVPEGCWFINIGAEGFGDRADSAFNRTGRTVNIANWNGSAWVHLAGVGKGAKVNLGGNSNKADAIHSLC